MLVALTHTRGPKVTHIQIYCLEKSIGLDLVIGIEKGCDGMSVCFFLHSAGCSQAVWRDILVQHFLREAKRETLDAQRIGKVTKSRAECRPLRLSAE